MIGATLLLVGIGAFAFFLFKLWLVANWVSGEYNGPMEIAVFWEWLRDPKNRRSLEPVVSLADMIIPLALGAASLMFGWLRAKDESQHCL